MNKKFFVIEDDANILFSLRAKLHAAGMQAETSSGTEDIEQLVGMIKKYSPDYIILDLLLPKNDGFAILKELKSDEDLSGRPVFIYTSLIDKDSREKCDQYGADYFFIKGETGLDEFIDKITRITSNLDKK